jgi:nitrogenase molybdenum-cofactor synthesis protein NifE
MSNLRSKSPRAREKRLDALSAWQGSAEAANLEFSGGEVVQRIRTFSQSSSDDLLLALRLLAGISGSVVIVHAPRGCIAAGLYHKVVQGRGRWLVTNLDEKDTIMGGDRKLRNAVTSAFRRYGPEVVFIVSGPVAAINNDDVQSVALELEEELGVTVIPVFTTGFASRNAVTGYDIALHALMKHLAGKPGEHEGVNVVNLLSLGEHPSDREEAVRLLGAFGAEVNVLTDGASAENFRRATGAKFSISLSSDFSNYLAEVLRDDYGVPHIELPRPVGPGATGRWLAAVGEALGCEKEAREFHEQESGRIPGVSGEFFFNGIRFYLSLSPATAAAVADLLDELGGDVAGITLTHLDRLHHPCLESLALSHPPLNIHVADGQPFEELNIVRRLAPDIYIGDSAHTAQVARLGIPVLSLEDTPLFGYRGVALFARRVAAALQNRGYTDALAKVGTPYRESWYNRSPNWHIKKEVK